MPTTTPVPTIAAIPCRSSSRRLIACLRASQLFRDYQRAFQDLTGLPLVLRAPDSFAPPFQDAARPNALCALMNEHNKTCAACLRLQHQFESGPGAEPCTQQCFAGLTESIIPIRVGQFIAGYIQTGQVLLCRPTPHRFRRLLTTLRNWDVPADVSRLRKAYFESRVLERRHYEAVVRLVEIFAQYLARVSDQLLLEWNGGASPQIERACRFIAEHYHEIISTRDAARAAGMSPFYFCKKFKEATRQTFTDYLARIRVEAVKRLLCKPHIRVSEAAFTAGFQSLSQFNRVFRRIAGQAPIEYRATLGRPKAGLFICAPLGEAA